MHDLRERDDDDIDMLYRSKARYRVILIQVSTLGVSVLYHAKQNRENVAPSFYMVFSPSIR